MLTKKINVIAISDARRSRVRGFDVVADGTQPEESAFQFKEKPVAKSSTSVLKATVCQTCGHPFDGQKNSSLGADGLPCKCFCHRGA